MPAVTAGTVIAQLGPALRAYALNSGQVLWTSLLRTGGQLGGTNVVTAVGRAYVASVDSVFAVDLLDGRRLWAYLPDAQAAACEIAADNEAVYVGTRSRRVYRLDASTGGPVWSVDIGLGWTYDGWVSGVAVSGDTVYVNAVRFLNPSGGFRTANVVALSKQTGAELWRFVGPDSANDATAAPRVSGDLLLVAHLYHNGGGGSFFALDRFNGTLLWRVRMQGLGPNWAPTVNGDVVFAGGNDARVYAVSRAGQPRWTTPVDGSVLSFALCGSALLVNNLQILALDRSSGRIGERLFVDPDGPYPLSGIAVNGSQAFVVGNKAAYGLECG